MIPMEFYQKHLDRVSRSFAYCISHLEMPLRSWVSLTYLICRILDTVEDAPWKKPGQQLKQFGEFDYFLRTPPNEEAVNIWQTRFPVEIPEGEMMLVKDSAIIFRELHDVPIKARGVIQEMVASMSAGMQYYSRAQNNSGGIHLTNIREVNQYCFFVAGIVGETLARLVAQIEPRLNVVQKFVREAHHFGLFLQKVNLLKDQLEDEREGRFLVPSREEIRQSMGKNAWGAWLFLKGLPLEQRGFRLFCAQSLFLGLASLPWTEKSYAKKKMVKIPRWVALKLFNQLGRSIDNHEYLEKLFAEMLKKAELPMEKFEELSGENIHSLSPVKEMETPWYLRLYQGSLVNEDFFDLGLAGA